MLKDLLDSKYKSNVIKSFAMIFNNNYKLTAKLLDYYLDKGYDDKQIFKLFHAYYWRKIKVEPNKKKEAEYRAMAKTKMLKELLTGVKYDKKAYLDIGCEECILPLSFGEVLGIKDVNCVNIEDWESHYDLNKTNMEKCQFKYYDGTNLPYPSNSFSVISASMVLHHIKPEDRAKLLDSIYKVMTERGLFIIREHDSTGKEFDEYVDFVHRFYDAVLLKKSHWLDSYGTYYQSEKDWHEELNKHGFKVIRGKVNNKKEDRPFMTIYVKK